MSQHHFLIEPYGLRFTESTAVSQIKAELVSLKMMNHPYDLSQADWVQHTFSSSTNDEERNDPCTHFRV